MGVLNAVPRSMAAEEKEWRAESDMNTLLAAEKIKADPKRLKPAMAKMREQQKALRATMAKK